MLHESGEINLLTRELSNILWKDFARKKPLLPKILIFVLINSYLRNYLMFKTCGDLRENVFLCTNITQGGVYIIYCRLFRTPWEFFIKLMVLFFTNCSNTLHYLFFLQDVIFYKRFTRSCLFLFHSTFHCWQTSLNSLFCLSFSFNFKRQKKNQNIFELESIF